MEEKDSLRKWSNAILILILLADLFMITMCVLSFFGKASFYCYPPALQMAAFLLVLAAVSYSLIENNHRKK